MVIVRSVRWDSMSVLGFAHMVLRFLFCLQLVLFRSLDCKTCLRSGLILG